jgi:hypothetical protein
MAFHLAARLEEGVAERNLARLEQGAMDRIGPVLEEVRTMRAIPTLWRMVEQQSWDPENRLVESTKGFWDEALTKMGAHDHHNPLRRAVDRAQDAKTLDDPRLVQANAAFLTAPRIFQEAPLEGLMVATVELARMERQGRLPKAKARARGDDGAR